MVSILSVVVYAINTLYYSTTIDREFVYRNFTTPMSGSDSSSGLSPEWGLWMYKKKVISTFFSFWWMSKLSGIYQFLEYCQYCFNHWCSHPWNLLLLHEQSVVQVDFQEDPEVRHVQGEVGMREGAPGATVALCYTSLHCSWGRAEYRFSFFFNRQSLLLLLRKKRKKMFV